MPLSFKSSKQLSTLVSSVTRSMAYAFSSVFRKARRVAAPVVAVSLCSALFSLNVGAAEADKKIAGKISAKINSSYPDMQIDSVETTEVKGMYRVLVQGRDLYVLEDGKYFLTGDLYRTDPNNLVNVSEELRGTERAALLASINRKDNIIYSPKDGTKKSISVYTDVDCGYCRKFHQEIPRLNAMGIEVRYLAFPRAGVGSPSYQKIASAWCSADKQDALNKLKNRESIPTNVCENNPVAKQYELGQQMGVTGTPSLVLDDGTVIPGYMPADQLAARLGL